MECGLIQELIDAHNIVDQSNGLDDVIASQGNQKFTIKDWFLKHGAVMHQLHLTPENITYALVNKRINQAMADLF
ncbi:hypothetical protein [Acetilactobacillus jinshanensis]|uniref:Uncharacterized protein n=1 Tax=Acetilactobacillus jinshanensis TaxID=1720083 RepID=A0A4P6ZLQ4_9LACO|nr:hypothetical protein [Acetilactobacillus jinshanensis]QBP18523.1 hypothetical protein ELX58_05125 [Acetilactobacillus jinshanensis]URL61396.1 hypothetical protein HGK75_05250 [uncultured bacterium]